VKDVLLTVLPTPFGCSQEREIILGFKKNIDLVSVIHTIKDYIIITKFFLYY